MALNIPKNIEQVLQQLVPASIFQDIACYVFYDNHPRDVKNIDVIVCTRLGDVREYFQRDLVCAVNIGGNYEPTEIKTLRNSRGDLFYLIAGGEGLTILSRKEKLQVNYELTCVDQYEITDVTSSGLPSLKITLKGDATPVYTQPDNFETFRWADVPIPPSSPPSNESRPIVKHLINKLKEAKNVVKSNENLYQQFFKIRQAAAYSTYKMLHPNVDDSLFKDLTKNLGAVLNINAQKPWIKTCNKKVVIVYAVCNRNEVPLHDVYILLHGTTRCSIEYKTRIFEKLNTAPFWEETKSLVLKPHTEYAITLVIDIDELKDYVISKLKFNGVIMYKQYGKRCLLPIEDVELTSMDTMGQEFDVLCSDACENQSLSLPRRRSQELVNRPKHANILLAILASSEKIDLVLKEITKDISDDVNLTADIFCKYLGMEQVVNAKNIVIHRKSPYHALNGIMIVLHEEKQTRKDQLHITVYSRSSSQVLAMIHHINDAVPYPIVTTTPTQNMTSKNQKLSVSNDTNTTLNIEPEYNYTSYVQSMLKRTSLVLEYLDNMLMSMQESKQSEERDKIGKEIDLVARGVNSYRVFRNKMRVAAASSANITAEDATASNDVMCID